MNTFQEKEMSDSIALANYFIEQSLKENADITLLKLVKLVYIAHGFLLALLNKSFINERYDKVEAWRFGPVIPTVYHTFKYNANNPIKERGVVFLSDDNKFVYPKISQEAVLVLDFVWKRYGKMSSSTLVDLLHIDGSPWKTFYIEGKNVEIPDSVTKGYYAALFKYLLNSK